MTLLASRPVGTLSKGAYPPKHDSDLIEAHCRQSKTALSLTGYLPEAHGNTKHDIVADNFSILKIPLDEQEDIKSKSNEPIDTVNAKQEELACVTQVNSLIDAAEGRQDKITSAVKIKEDEFEVRKELSDSANVEKEKLAYTTEMKKEDVLEGDYSPSFRLLRPDNLSPLLNAPFRGSHPVTKIVSHLVTMSLESESGSRSIQRIIIISSILRNSFLVKSLLGSIRQLSTSPHGNHVIQLLIRHLPAFYWRPLLTELISRPHVLAKNAYGCRVLCRLAEESVNFSEWLNLVEGLLDHVPVLATHKYGRFVIRSLLNHGCNDHKVRILAIITSAYDKDGRDSQ